MGVLFVLVWIATMLLPIPAAIGCWGLSQSLRKGWLVHLLFGPGLIAIELLLIEAMFWVSGDTGDGPPGLGLAVLPALAFLVLSIVTYYAVLGAVGLKRLIAVGMARWPPTAKAR